MDNTLVAGQPVIVPTGTSQGSNEVVPQQGYINASYYGNESNKVIQDQTAATQDAQAVQELAQKLGVDPNTLLEGQQPTEQVTEPETPPTETEDFLAKFNTEEGKRFREQFTQFLGVDPVSAYETVQNAARLTAELENWRQGMVVQQEQQQLRAELGNEYDALMPEVVDYFNSLPNEKKAALDNLDGARMIAALIRQRKAQEMRGAGTNAPQFVNGNVRPTNGRAGSPYIRMSEMVTWDGATLDARMADIQRAKANGTFIYDL